MQVRYREKIVYAGDMIFGAVYPTFRKAGARRGKFRETSEIQAKLNERKSLDRLTWAIHTNFGKSDYVLHPTYRTSCLPESEEAFEADARNYIRRLKRIYKKQGVELRYIYVMEYSDSGASRFEGTHEFAQGAKLCGRPHLHIIVSGGVDRSVIEEAWGKGRCNADRLQYNECGVVDLSSYIGKQRRCGKHRYVTSKNLRKPVEKTNVHTWSRKQLKELEESGANPHKKFADAYHGYWLSEYPHIEKNGINGGIYMTFTMFRPDSVNLAWYRRTEEYKRRKEEIED